MNTQAKADAYRAATGASRVTYREERREADGTLTVTSEATSHSEREQQMLDADAKLRESDVSTLLRSAYSLTHQMHVEANVWPYSEKMSELRMQRDLIDAEIERRCAR